MQLEDEAHELVEVRVGVRVLVADVVVDARGRHERRADRLDLLHVAKVPPVEDLVKVGDQLVEHAQELAAALEGLVVLRGECGKWKLAHKAFEDKMEGVQ